MGDQRVHAPTQILDSALIQNVDEIRFQNNIFHDLYFPTTLECIKWLVQRRLLHNKFLCQSCNIQMSFIKHPKVQDGYQWQCKICKKRLSIRRNSFFFHSSLKLEQVLQIVYGWANDCSHDFIKRQARLGQESTHTSIGWFSFCRDICEKYFISNEIVIGGLNEDGTSKIVDIDESNYFYCEYHLGRWIEGHWVLGGIEKESRRCFLVEVPDRSRATVSAIIQRHILPGSIITSYDWKSYNLLRTLKNDVYELQDITREKSIWIKAKRKVGKPRGISVTSRPSYLHDFLWRKQFPTGQVFQEFIICLATQYLIQ